MSKRDEDEDVDAYDLGDLLGAALIAATAAAAGVTAALLHRRTRPRADAVTKSEPAASIAVDDRRVRGREAEPDDDGDEYTADVPWMVDRLN